MSNSRLIRFCMIKIFYIAVLLYLLVNKIFYKLQFRNQRGCLCFLCGGNCIMKMECLHNVFEGQRRQISLIVWLVLCSVLPCFGQEVPEEKRFGNYSLYYYCDRIDIDNDYLDNAFQIRRIKDILLNSPKIDSITIYAFASPEGSPARNVWLAEQRAVAAKRFILNILSDSSVLLPENIHLRPMGENWDGLKEELVANYHLQNRDKVLSIIDADIPTETKKWRLKRLDNGYTYSYIISRHMPKLRMATWICAYTPIEVVTIKVVQSAGLQMPQSLQPIAAPKYESFERKTILALKSNLLYDALSLVNFSVEVPIAKKFSALYYHQFPWWRWGDADNEHCVRFLSMGFEGRWWFNRKCTFKNDRKRDKLVGHFLGLYAESGKWDFQWDRSICHQGEHWSVGLSYGYAMPIGRKLNMEFSLSMGYASIPYRKFFPSDDYEILWRDPEVHGRWHYFGPTKAQVSLVVPIRVKVKKRGGEL